MVHFPYLAKLTIIQVYLLVSTWVYTGGLNNSIVTDVLPRQQGSNLLIVLWRAHVHRCKWAIQLARKQLQDAILMYMGIACYLHKHMHVHIHVCVYVGINIYPQTTASCNCFLWVAVLSQCMQQLWLLGKF